MNLVDSFSFFTLSFPNNIIFVPDRFAKSKSALFLFSGFVTLPSLFFNFTGDFSLSAWINLQSDYSYLSPLFYCGSPSMSNAMMVNLQNYVAFFGIRDASSDNITTSVKSNTSLDLKTWYNLVVTLNSKCGSIFINGDLTGFSSTMNSPRHIGTGHCFLGKSDLIADIYSIAIFDDIMFFNRALSKQQIVSIILTVYMPNSYNRFSSSLLSSWNFNINLNTINADYALDIQSSVTNVSCFVSDRIGAPSSALALNGLYTLITSANQIAFNHDFTISLWLNMASFEALNAPIIECSASSDGQIFTNTILGSLVDGAPWFYSIDKNTLDYNPAFSPQISVYNWTHLAFNVKALIASTFVNAEKIAQIRLSSPVIASHKQCSIGRSQWLNQVATGLQLDDIRIFAIALNSTQIATLMNVYEPISMSDSARALGATNMWSFNSNLFDLASDFNLTNVVNVSFVTDRFGWPQKAAYLNSGSLRIPEAIGLFSTGSDFTFAAWIYVLSLSMSESRLLDCGTALPGQANVVMALQRSLTRQPYFALWSNGRNATVMCDKALPLNGWIHYAAGVTGSVATIWLNGVMKGSYVVPFSIPITNRTQCYIGKDNWPGGQSSKIYLDDMMWLNVGATKSLISTLKNIAFY